MSKEFDLAALASAGGWLKWRRKHADIAPGTPCMNCETPLEGTYCHNCGQLAETFHKSIWHLVAEVLESFFHWDGRLWRTMPALVYKPGELTSHYINGKRTYQVPPLRLFLVLLVMIFFAGQYGMGGKGHGQDNFNWVGPSAGDTGANGRPLTGAQARAAARAEIVADKSMSEADRRVALAAIDRDWSKFGGSLAESIVENSAAASRERAARTAVTVDPATGKQRAAVAPGVNVSVDNQANSRVNKWFVERAEAIRDDPQRFFLVLETWAHRVAVLALPVSALILSLLFVFQRRFYVYDHLIFSMHSLSFQLLLLSTLWITARWFGPWVWWFLWAAPVHLFVHMRGTYQTGVFFTLLRMFILFILTVIAFALLTLLLFYLGFNDMAPSH
jgi:hypothetical protein